MKIHCSEYDQDNSKLLPNNESKWEGTFQHEHVKNRHLIAQQNLSGEEFFWKEKDWILIYCFQNKFKMERDKTHENYENKNASNKTFAFPKTFYRVSGLAIFC